MEPIQLPTRTRAYFENYESFHHTRGNRWCHLIGIPLIVVALLGLLSGWQPWPQSIPSTSGLARLDGGTLLLVLGLIWYFYLDWRIATPFGLVATGLYFLGRAMPVPLLWSFFVLGWILQFVGHYAFEKKSPAFLTNIRHLLVGPIWIFAKLIGYTR
jgi:uncharacterized membrane protein YGL010W